MIVVTVTIDTQPGTLEKLSSAIAALEAATRAEAGCVDYAFSSEVNAPDRLRVVERWRDVDALKAHLAAPHMAAFNAAVRANPPVRVDVKMFDARELPFPPQ
jgi:quinol monooxygenase YgiN